MSCEERLKPTEEALIRRENSTEVNRWVSEFEQEGRTFRAYTGQRNLLRRLIALGRKEPETMRPVVKEVVSVLKDRADISDHLLSIIHEKIKERRRVK